MTDCDTVVAGVADNSATRPGAQTGDASYKQALRASEERFRRFAMASGYGLAMGELSGQLVFANAATLRIVEEACEADFTAKTFYEYYTPQDVRRLQDEILPVVLETGQWVGEIPLVSARGKLIPTEQNIFLIRDEQGEPRLVGNIITDICERKHAEKVRQLNEARLEALLRVNQMTEASFQEITDFAIEQAVRLTESTIGYLAFLSEDEAILTMHAWSKSAMAECAILDKPIVYPVAETGLWGEVVRQRVPIITNDYAAPNPLKKGYPKGHVAVRRHMNVPIFHGDRIVIVAGVGNKEEPYDASDVRQLTLLMQGMWQWIERNRAAELLRESKERLEQYAAALESSNLALEQSNRLAEAGTRAKSEFLANMSHEIRTPLTAILGYADLMLGEESGGPPENWREACETIKHNGEHLLGVINDILDLSKVESGKMVIESVRCSPIDVMADVVSLMRVRAEAKSLRLEADVVGALPATIVTDPLRLRQVLINLVGNAIKFTDRGEVRITALVTQQEHSPRLRFDVTDTGIGMDVGQIEKLFQPFSQVDSSAARKFGGSGLGLRISKRLAEALGGTIVVWSAPGQGSTFRVTIDPGPLEAVPMIPPGQVTAIGAVAGVPPAAKAKISLPCRILLAEDGADNRRLIRLMLEKAGATVIAVENGKIAVEAALAECRDGQPFDVILMDMQMPVVDGYTAARQLREQGYRGSIVALTAHAMAEDRQKCLDAGCDGYATKPIDRQKLLATIARWTDRKSCEVPRLAAQEGAEHGQPCEGHSDLFGRR